MGDLALLIAAIAGGISTILGGVATLVVALRGSRRDVHRAADSMLTAALSEQDKKQDDRLERIEKQLRGGDPE